MTVFHVATTGSDARRRFAEQPVPDDQPRGRRRAAGRHGRRARRRVPRVGQAAARRDQRPAAHHLRGRGRRARRHQGLGAGDRVGAASAGTVWRAAVPNDAVRHLQPVRRGDRRRLDRLRRADAAEEAPRRRVPERPELLRGGEPGGGRRTRRCAPRCSTTGPRRPTASATPSRRGTSGTPRSATTRRRSGRTSRAPTRTRELVEINVRRSVFYPTEHHLDYITVRGFELAQAACPWTPPTADQPGLIGPNWAKGWIIEDNVIHDAKCSAISLGKEASTGHNYATAAHATSPATSTSWSRCSRPGRSAGTASTSARTSSAATRSTTAARTASSGHLGCVFSTIEDNHIYNIALKREFYGYEIGGIKLHAAIDVVIRHNRIHDCSLGTWLDWQTQGTRVSRNLYYANSRDLFVEVSHGPYLVDHNVLASPASLELVQPGRRVRQQPRVRHACRSSRSSTGRRRTTCRTARRSPATPRSSAATTATSATSSSAATSSQAYGPDARFGQRGRPRHRRCTTATRRRSPTTSR